VCIGQPNNNGQLEGEKWSKAMEDVERAMKEAGEKCSFDYKALHHHCRPFPALAAGISFSGGHTITSNLIHSGVN